jgi:hypothetical protein
MRKFEALSEVIVDSSISLGTPNEIASAPHLDEFVCPLRYFLQELIIELSELISIPSYPWHANSSPCSSLSGPIKFHNQLSSSQSATTVGASNGVRKIISKKRP